MQRRDFLDRYAMINAELGLVNVGLVGKTGWLHGNAAVRNRPEMPRSADPWLPSPYPGDSYRDANVALVKEAVTRFGAHRVTWTNTGCPRAEERRAQSLPDYVQTIDDCRSSSARLGYCTLGQTAAGAFDEMRVGDSSNTAQEVVPCMSHAS